MSLPLSRCSDCPPIHQFQHELESFIWSFFILSGFRCGRRFVNSDLEKWYTSTWEFIEDAKNRFLKAGQNRAESAGQFDQSLGVDPQPLAVYPQLLAGMLIDSEQLDAAHLLSALQETRDAYAARE